MLKMMEKENNDKGELIDRTACFTGLAEGQTSLYEVGLQTIDVHRSIV